jgi:MinD-like ATPase involved in chromosome partitioning or flagellar assembly/ActR/RegA family two-component response regulator
MPQQAIIVSQDEVLVGTLSRGLASAEVCAQPTALGYYPETVEIRGLIDSSPDPVAVVLIDLTGQSRALDLIRRLRESHPGVVTLAVDRAPSRASFNGATEAGAWGYLAPPFDIGPLAEHFQLRAQDRKAGAATPEVTQHPAESEPGAESGPGAGSKPQAEAERGILISFMPVQGGNGASTAALHVAQAIARDPAMKVLLLDFDFHSGTVAFRLRLKPEHTVADLLKNNHLSGEDLTRLAGLSNGFHVLVAPPSNTAVSVEMLGRIPAVLDSARRVCDYVIADLPDPLFSSSRAILKMSDRVYLVCTPEITSLHLARRKAQQLRDAGVPNDRLGLLVNRVGAWGSFQPSEVQRVVGAPVVWTLDNDYASLHEATLAGGLLAEDSSLSKQFQKFAEHMRATLATAPAVRA